MNKNKETSGKQPILHAGGSFEELCRDWWNKHHKSGLDSITLKGDGYVCFYWSENGDQGKYYIPFNMVYGEMK